MRRVGNNYRQTSELHSVDFFPPDDHCGYYGLVEKPIWMPRWLAYLLRNKLPVYLGWLNMPRCDKPYDNPTNIRHWWIYPTGENNFEGNSVRVRRFLWCEIEYVNKR